MYLPLFLCNYMNTSPLESRFPDTQEGVILYFKEDIDFDLPSETRLEAWIKATIATEQAKLQQLSYIFCSDTYLHQLNVEYLDHDTLTDVISFPYAEPPNIQGDIFISIDRIRENAATFGVAFEQELLRVMSHGLLHFCGYGDKTEAEAQLMRTKENEALERWHRLSN